MQLKYRPTVVKAEGRIGRIRFDTATEARLNGEIPEAGPTTAHQTQHALCLSILDGRRIIIPYSINVLCSLKMLLVIIQHFITKHKDHYIFRNFV